MLKRPLFAAFIASISFSATANETALIFRGPGNTHIYADSNCSERTKTEQYEITQPAWIDCAIDGNRTTVLISPLPARSDVSWFGYKEAAEIVDRISADTEWEGYGGAINFQGGASVPGIPMSYLEASGIKCEGKSPCKLDGKKVYLIVIGHKTQSVALLAVGDGFVDKIRAIHNGKEYVAASQRRFPRAMEAMISTFNFSIFKIQPDLLRKEICDERSKLECIP
ncbi:hypothetical protein GAO09_08215 [Rhizobiales bacterium RZME27]|uniref:Uncharacterized protein n=1 Tax=Endobacterium cereale TaxID=2663029 RepID=A0A6A8A4U8_9HYPH|nr:hypothetical protein [Endobacterium cereale]MQY46043.1 hypothetical protein [Endobacterium cereale]